MGGASSRPTRRAAAPTSGGAACTEPCARPGGGEGVDRIVAKIHELQRELALLSAPLLALPEAAEVLVARVGADAVGVYAFAPDRPACAVLLAAHGRGAEALRLHPVGRQLPQDFALLRAEGGQRSLAAVAVGPPGQPLGVLVLGKCQPGGWPDMWLDAAATGLLQHVRHQQVSEAARMLAAVDEAPDCVAAIGVLLQSGTGFMWRAANASMGVRLALVEDGHESALVFEWARAPASGLGASPARPSRAASLPRLEDAGADISVRELRPLSNTLMASAVAQRKARFVSDVSSYLQNCAHPARDVLTHASRPVSSVVVVPLLAAPAGDAAGGGGGGAFGALYFSHEDAPCDFSNVQEPILGFVHAVTPVLHARLAGKVGLLQERLELACPPKSRSLSSLAEPCTSGPVACLIDCTASESRSGGAAAAGGGDADGGPTSDVGSGVSAAESRASGSTRRLSKVYSHRQCTEAMLKLLQQEIQKGKRRSVELSFVKDHLVINGLIGQGGFGRVYRGSWHKRPAAIKVMHARHTDCGALSDAMEMAVLSSVAHPGIVQVYSCLTDMVEVSGLGAAGGMDGAPAYRRVEADDDEAVQLYNVVVMEYCDRGTLSDAVRRRGLFHRRLASGSVGINFTAVLEVLVDVASSLTYLHGISLLHGDVKLDNVLLKSDPLRSWGAAPKLADFGLTRIIKDAHGGVTNHSGAGTVTHLAPELFTAGSLVTAAVDTYAFGVLIHEAITAAPSPYPGLDRGAVGDFVRQGGRPSFPPGTPRRIAELAAACWAHRPEDRPTMDEVGAALQGIADAATAATAAGAATAPLAQGPAAVISYARQNAAPAAYGQQPAQAHPAAAAAEAGLPPLPAAAATTAPAGFAVAGGGP